MKNPCEEIAFSTSQPGADFAQVGPRTERFLAVLHAALICRGMSHTSDLSQKPFEEVVRSVLSNGLEIHITRNGEKVG